MPISSKDVQFYPLGDAAVILQFEDEINDRTQEAILAISAFLDEYAFEGLIEYVPAYTSVTLFYEPLHISYFEILENLKEMLEEITIEAETVVGDLVEIPVHYSMESGPDLEFVAAECGLSTAQVIELHSHPIYRVNMIGFSPGFPYLSGMHDALEVGRRTHPRAMVPAGSVGIAGKQTGVYPMTTPGGWQIIGRTPLRLFDIERPLPSLLKAGDRLRFISITKTEFERMESGY